jgi:pyruvate kinase
MERRAKIMATLGPASSSPEVLRLLLEAGVDIIRLNLSHGSQEQHRATIELVRRTAEEARRYVPIVLDLMGPRYRLGEVPGGQRELITGETVRLVPAGEVGPGEVPIGDVELLDHLKAGERVLIDNGLVELVVESVGAAGTTARVVHGGPIKNRKGLNLPETSLPFTISEKDRGDIAFAVEVNVDYLAASYVGRAEDVEAIRNLAVECGIRMPIIAKLERASIVDRLDELVAASDAVMVARGDLGVEVPLHQVPVLQKEIIAAGRRGGKPVIVATQMLESMMELPRPTRAEASDVANAVFDGADALMLSGETAAGRYPVESVRTMARIALEAEAYVRRPNSFEPPEQPLDGAPPPLEATAMDIAAATSAAAAHAALRLGVKTIVAFSQGGFTARMIARNRPEAKIFVFTTDSGVARRTQLVWGVRPLVMDAEVQHHDQVVSMVERLLLAQGLARPNETILILMGDPIRDRPLTNLMRVHRLKG